MIGRNVKKFKVIVLNMKCKETVTFFDIALQFRENRFWISWHCVQTRIEKHTITWLVCAQRTLQILGSSPIARGPLFRQHYFLRSGIVLKRTPTFIAEEWIVLYLVRYSGTFISIQKMGTPACATEPVTRSRLCLIFPGLRNAIDPIKHHEISVETRCSKRALYANQFSLVSRALGSPGDWSTSFLPADTRPDAKECIPWRKGRNIACRSAQSISAFYGHGQGSLARRTRGRQRRATRWNGCSTHSFHLLLLFRNLCRCWSFLASVQRILKIKMHRETKCIQSVYHSLNIPILQLHS